jgi:hypothetical protein
VTHASLGARTVGNSRFAFRAAESRARHFHRTDLTYGEGDLIVRDRRDRAIAPSTSPGLLPKDANARDMAIMWSFAALNTIRRRSSSSRVPGQGTPWSKKGACL